MTLQKNTPLRSIMAAVTMAGIAASSAHAAPDPAYNANDLLLFFLNPTGTVGSDRVVAFSLGSTWDRFRTAATPTSATFGTTIPLGNINTVLTNAYGANWTSLASSIFVGAAGQNAPTGPFSTAVSNGDRARTIYVTKPRAGAGTLSLANSITPSSAAAITGTASAISSANSFMLGQPNPHNVLNTALGVNIDDQNPFTPPPPSGVPSPATAYGSIPGGIMGSLSTGTYSLGSIHNIVLGLDLYRITPVANAAGSWEVVNSIPGVVAAQGYYLGTITLSGGANAGDVNFVAIPEPSSAMLLAIAGAAGMLFLRRRKANLPS